MINCTFCQQFESENLFDFAQTRTETQKMNTGIDENTGEVIKESKEVTLAVCKPCFKEGKTINV